MADTNTARKTIRLRIKRQDGPDQPARWEEFALPYKPNMNVISCLMEIQQNPQTADGRPTAPVVWDSNCLEEVCGACSMIINGKVRQACSALVDNLINDQNDVIELEPMGSFPLVRDLVVNRDVMFEHLKRIKGWIPIDGTYDLGPGPRQNPKDQEWMYELSKCMTCGCCLEACPNFNTGSKYIGPAAISQARLFNGHPTGKMIAEERLEALMEPGGVTDCGQSQNCVEVCPKGIPLTTSIAEMHRQTTKYGFSRWFRR